METHRIIETIGSITKIEQLQTVDHLIMPNTCVIEAKEPFSGYYGRHPQIEKPMHVFIVIKGDCDLYKLMRATQKIKNDFDINFDACKSEISLFNISNQAIRIKDINSYEIIREIQEHFVYEGFQLKTRKRQIDNMGLVKIQKSFFIEEIEPSLFIDKVEKEISYLTIPKNINYKLFEKYTEIVKNNWQGESFDAALCSFVRVQGIVDAIRIYMRDQSEKCLQKLLKLYLNIMID